MVRGLGEQGELAKIIQRAGRNEQIIQGSWEHWGYSSGNKKIFSCRHFNVEKKFVSLRSAILITNTGSFMILFTVVLGNDMDIRPLLLRQTMP